MKYNKTILVVVDGWGIGPDYEGNAVRKANTPFIDTLMRKYPNTQLHACGRFVGLPKGGLGGSEVGHLTMGAGRIVFQPMVYINNSIKDGSFYKKKELKDTMGFVHKNNSRLHLLGMISDKGIHSDVNHMFALLKMAKKEGVKEVYIHAITDGRDVPERSAKQYVSMISDKINELNLGKIATIVGRYYAMDRDKNWNRTKKAYDLYIKGIGEKENNALDALENAYKRGVKTDYYIDPILLEKEGVMQSGDAVIFFNFRTDRTIQITRSLTEPKFNEFDRGKKPELHFACFGPYSDICSIVFTPEKVENGLGEVIANNNLTQLRIAETEKYAHVTFFFNGQKKEPFKNEDRVVVPSPKVKSYSETPEMNASGVTEAGINGINKNYDFILLNYANMDLVGHSGDFDAAVKAVECIDKNLEKLYNSAIKQGYQLLITADHGNADYMIYEDTGEPAPAHSYAPVPVIIIGSQFGTINIVQPEKEGLASIAPTILKMMNIGKPEIMTGNTLF